MTVTSSPLQDLDAERSVLGSMMTEPAVIDLVPDLRPADFALARHEAIAAAIFAERADTGAADPVAVRARLEREGRLEEAGGFDYLIDLAESVLTGRHVEVHAAIVRERAAQRRVRDVGLAMVQRTQDGGDAGQVAAEAEALLRAAAGAASSGTGLDRRWAPLVTGCLSIAPKARRWLLRHPDGEGLLPQGKGGIFTAEGGAGKTTAELQLAVSIATGRPWFGHFEIDEAARGGRSFLLLAEEAQEDVHRTLYRVAEQMELSEREKQAVEERVVIAPMAGEYCALLQIGLDGQVNETPTLHALRRRLRAEGPWQFVALGPLNRLAGGDINKSTQAGIAMVQAIESLTSVPGNPTVLTDHHSSKDARKAGKVDSKGVVDLTDGFRWHATLRVDKGSVFFIQAKSNYSRPMTQEIELAREQGGILRAVHAQETASAQAAEIAAEHAEIAHHQELVLANLRKLGSASSIDEACAGCGVGLPKARIAFRRCLTAGSITNTKTDKRPHFVIVRKGGGDTPTPPADVGTPSSALSGLTAERPDTSSDAVDARRRRDLE